MNRIRQSIIRPLRSIDIVADQYQPTTDKFTAIVVLVHGSAAESLDTKGLASKVVSRLISCCPGSKWGPYRNKRLSECRYKAWRSIDILVDDKIFSGRDMAETCFELAQMFSSFLWTRLHLDRPAAVSTMQNTRHYILYSTSAVGVFDSGVDARIETHI